MFGNVPDAVKVAFYTVIPVLLVYGAVLFANRVKNWQRGAPDDRSTTTENVKRRLGDFRAGVYMQTLLRDPVAGVMHSMIYFGFLVLVAVTAVLEIDHQLPDDAKFLHGVTYQAYSFVGDAAGLVFLAGIAMAVAAALRHPALPDPHQVQARARADPRPVRRPRPHRLRWPRSSASPSTAAPSTRSGASSATRCRPWSTAGAAWPAGTRPCGSSTSCASWASWLILPVTMLRHMFTSPLNMYLRDRERPKGAMKPLPNLMETELESFGASTVSEMTWKQLLDTDSCTMCGRCTSVCPAHATGKPLDPREIVLKTGEVMAAVGHAASCRPRSASTPRSPSPPTASSSGSPPRRSGPARRARPATRSAR